LNYKRFSITAPRATERSGNHPNRKASRFTRKQKRHPAAGSLARRTISQVVLASINTQCVSNTA
jgi:hypothetical protein